MVIFVSYTAAAVLTSFRDWVGVKITESGALCIPGQAFNLIQSSIITLVSKTLRGERGAPRITVTKPDACCDREIDASNIYFDDAVPRLLEDYILRIRRDTEKTAPRNVSTQKINPMSAMSDYIFFVTNRRFGTTTTILLLLL